jgi:hypothetical protein
MVASLRDRKGNGLQPVINPKCSPLILSPSIMLPMLRWAGSNTLAKSLDHVIEIQKFAMKRRNAENAGAAQ